jgi:Na+/H+ antiporter NhaD/arsenite permease-like protein
MEMETPDLSWKSYVSLAVFLVSLVFVIRQVPVPLPAALRNRRWAQSLLVLDCATSPLLACLLLLALTCTSAEDIRLGIVGTPDSLQPYTIIILFFALAYLCISLDVTGFLRHIAYRAVDTTNTPGGMFRAVYALASVLTVVTSNDIVVLTMTPLITYMTAAKRIDPLPHLMAQFHAANSWATFLYISNPTNIILCQAFGITFMQYSAWMSMPSVFSNFTAFLILLLICRPSKPGGKASASIKNESSATAVQNRKDGASIQTEGPFPARPEDAFAASEALDIRWRSSVSQHENTTEDLKPVSTQANGQAPAEQQASSAADSSDQYAVHDMCGAAFDSVLLVACIVVLLLTSITPIPVWAATLPFALVVLLRDAGHDYLLWREMRANRAQHTPQQSSTTIGLAPTASQALSSQESVSAARREYIVPVVAKRLPWKVAPFVVCTFILVETLQSTGWVAILGNFVYRLSQNLGALPTLLIVGFLSIAGISLCNNQPITILIAKILLHATRAAGRGPKNLKSGDLALVFGCVVASNLGALLTLNGALAGLMWMKMLQDHKVHLKIGRFMWIGALVTVPTFVVALVALWIEALVVG